MFFVRPNIDKLKARGDINALIRALAYDRDEHVCEEAARALREIGPAAVEPLIATLANVRNPRPIRVRMAEVLGLIHDVRAVESLILALHENGPVGIEKDARDILRAMGTRAVGPLIAALRSDSARESAAYTLSWFGSVAIEPLVAAFTTANKQVQESVASILCRIGDARALEPLIAALGFESGEIRLAAVSQLGEIGGAQSVKALVAVALRDNDNYIRGRAADALGKIGDARAVKQLVEALQASDVSMRESAAAALDRLGWTPGKDALGATYWMARNEWNKCVEIGPPAVDPLIAALRDNDASGRYSAAALLGEIGDARATDPLIASLADADADVRKVVAKALGQIRNTRALEPLIAALRDNNELVCRYAADALAKIGDTRAVEPLIAALRTRKSVYEVPEALGEIGDARAVGPLIAALGDDDAPRGLVAEALGKIGDARAVEPLIAALRDNDARVRGRAAEALGKIGDARAVQPLTTMLRDDNESDRECAAMALERFTDAKAENALRTFKKELSNGNKQFQTHAKEVFRRVHGLLKSGGMYVQVQAMPCLDDLYDVLSRGQPKERLEAANLLRMVAPTRDERTYEVLVDGLQKERDWTVFRSILGALRGIEAIGVVSLLKYMLNQTQYAEVRESIQNAIEYLEGH